MKLRQAALKSARDMWADYILVSVPDPWITEGVWGVRREGRAVSAETP